MSKRATTYYIAYGHGSVYKDTSWKHASGFMKHCLDEGTKITGVWKITE